MIKEFDFGITKEGKRAKRYVLENSKGTQIEVSNFGALVLAIKLYDKANIKTDVVLGFDNLEDYYNTSTGFGAYVGRNANRIKDAIVTIEGTQYPLDANDNGNNLHSGYDRSHCKLYDVKCGENITGSYVEFFRISPHMEQGFPGNLRQTIRYILTEQDEFQIEYDMVADQTTVVNPTNHTYFNLNGHDSGSVLEHEMKVWSDTFLETDEKLIPTGKFINVDGTPMDFRKRKTVGKDISANYRALELANGYDHNYVFLNDGKMKKMASLYGEKSGIRMTVFSDLCGMQIYSGNFLNGEIGKDGTIYEKRNGICFETQFYPNACNNSKFPSSILEAGKRYLSKTIYQFEIK